MARHSSDGFEDLAASMLGLGLMLAALIITVTILVLVSVVTELGRVFQARAIQPTPARRILWGAVAALLSLWLLLAGIAAWQPAFGSVGAAIGAWALLVFILACELTDWYYRRLEQPVPIPESIPLSAVISWRPPNTQAAAQSPLQPVRKEA